MDTVLGRIFGTAGCILGILSFQLPFALIPLVKLVASREVMGELAARGWVRRGAVGCSVAVVAANVFLMSGMLFGGLDGSPAGVLAGLAAALFLLGYLAAMGYIAWKKVTFKLSAVNGARWAEVGSKADAEGLLAGGAEDSAL